MKNNIDFGHNLKKLRKKFGFTRVQLAEKLFYSEKSIEKWETGGAVPPIATICQIAEIFGVTVDVLLFARQVNIKYLLGIDGGGTKTEFLLTDLDKNVINRVVLGASNPVDIGIEKTEQILEQGISEVCRGMDLREISLFAGISGGITGQNKSLIYNFLSRFSFGLIDNGSDTENAISIALAEEDGIAVIMGTGIIAFAQQNGVRHRIGGWGYLIDKGGSGYNFGLDAIESALKYKDGRGGSPLLLELVEDDLSKPIEDSIGIIYKRGKSFIASFAKCVFTAFCKGDIEAEKIIDRNVKEVAQMILTGCKILGDKNPKIVICGGIANQEEVLRPFFEKYLDGQEITFAGSEPVVNGAILLAEKLSQQKDNSVEGKN